MIRFTAAHLEERSAQRPPGYREAVLALAGRDGDAYTLTAAAAEQIRLRFALPAAPPAPPPPPLRVRLATLARALRAWLRAGCPLTPAALYRRRLEICRACPNWDASPYLGTGQCRLCGCSTTASLRLLTYACPARPPRW